MKVKDETVYNVALDIAKQIALHCETEEEANTLMETVRKLLRARWAIQSQ